MPLNRKSRYLLASLLILPLLVWFLFVATRPAPGPRYTIRRLIAPGFESTRPLSINDFGQVVGPASNPIGDQANFIWDRDGKPTEIALSGEGSPFVMEVDNKGQALGNISSAGKTLYQFIWSSTDGVKKISFAPSARGWVEDMNNSGMLAGVTGPTDWSIRHATVWNASLEATRLEDTTSSYTCLINNRGTVLVRNERELVFADLKSARRIENFPESSFARGMNDLEQVVGMVFTATDGGIAKDYRAFVWSATRGTVYLGDLYGFDTEASAINNKGQVVGWAQPPDGSAPSRTFQAFIRFVGDLTHQDPVYWEGWVGSSAFLWERGELMDLNGLVANASDWISLCQATDINEAGEIVGSGIHRDVTPGCLTGFVLTPIKESGKD